MDYIGTTAEEQAEMLKALGVASVEDLLSAIPKSLLLPPYPEDGFSEREGLVKLTQIADKNTFSEYTSYLGGGAYDHYIPSVIAPILSRGEFLTSYTPYQPELSQGMLQALFEFQTAIAKLTGLEVANSSLYDGATASAEALMMAIRSFKGKREKVLVVRTLNHRYLEVIRLYLKDEVVLCDIESEVNEDVAAVLAPFPNYFGELEDPSPLFERAKKVGALSILVSHPLALAIYACAADLGADIAVGEGQPLGLPLQFGGPYVGYMAAKKELIREMPGRIVGETTDRNGAICYVLTLQAREQHIRREKATSNICTSQSLAALAMLLAIRAYGGKGLVELAKENQMKADFLKNGLLKIRGFEARSALPTFNEFAIQFPKPLTEVIPFFEKEHILPGIPLDSHSLLIAVTEQRTPLQLERYLALAKHFS